eukprot:CAMPEP_0176146544 /NCGR_PEP_ID=MMETSP0120_2-20121206/74683_1 /TAXON_ID=160619 /ORGANISM="Kryptoperidinium foliaceum, Strain CCMP 1326" /LENGTH=52 /DNA_ID=CAMNT_0017483099 /DNA_START=157 /DNA_END=311 /DNA_ORIENTATION=+
MTLIVFGALSIISSGMILQGTWSTLNDSTLMVYGSRKVTWPLLPSSGQQLPG